MAAMGVKPWMFINIDGRNRQKSGVIDSCLAARARLRPVAVPAGRTVCKAFLCGLCVEAWFSLAASEVLVKHHR